MATSLRGRLLVATPPLGDPNFDRSVVLLLDHNNEGAVGLTLDRPSDVPLGEALPGWGRVAAEPAVLYGGGPVAGHTAIGLGRVGSGTDIDGWHQLIGAIGTVDLEHDPDRLGLAVEAVRIFAGFAGWGPGQLEGEISAGAWFVLEASPEDAFSPLPQQLWRAVLRRQGGDLARLANVPRDLSVN